MASIARSGCGDAFTSHSRCAVVPSRSRPVIFPIPGDFPNPPRDKIISGVCMPGTRVAAGGMQLSCIARVACTVRRPLALILVSTLTGKASCSLAALFPYSRFLNACMHPENFSVEILKCRKKVEFTKSSHLLSGGSTFLRIHVFVLSFFPLVVVAHESNLEDRIPGPSRI